jgi:restriction system protein
VRGTAEIDVYATETVDGRSYTILVECKNWTARVPQAVIHGFRTVVADSGANLGYIVSAAGFQSGALTAAELTVEGAPSALPRARTNDSPRQRF